MKYTQLCKLIREEIRRTLKEVGDSSAGAYSVNGLSAVIAKFKSQIQKGATRTFTGNVKDNVNAGVISFTTEDGVKKEIYVGLEYNKKNNGYTMEVFVINPDSTTPDSYRSQEGTNLYKLMATVIAVCKKVTDSIQEINELKFESYPQWSKGEHAPDDTTAMRFILKYVKQAYSNISVRNHYGDIYVKLLEK